MWCKSAVSFSFLFLVTAPRMRACACDTAARLCVRTVLCSSAFDRFQRCARNGGARGGRPLFVLRPGTCGDDARGWPSGNGPVQQGSSSRQRGNQGCACAVERIEAGSAVLLV